MKKILSAIIIISVLTMALAGCAKTPDWENATNETVVATVEGEEFKYDLLKYIYFEKAVSAEISKDLDASIDELELSLDDTTESFTKGDALNRLICLAALSAVAQKENKAWDRQEAYDYTVETLTGNVDQYPYMQDYLDMMCEKLEMSQDELLTVAADELRILMDADVVAQEVLSETIQETESTDVEALKKKVAEKLANKIKGISVVNNMTGQKKYMPDFTTYSEEIVYLYMNNLQ